MSIPPPSYKGLLKAKQVGEAFAEELLDEAGRIAQRAEAEQASAEHVLRAAAHIYRGSRSRRSELIAAVGSLITGLAGGAFIAFLQDDPVNGVYAGLSAAVMFVAVGVAIRGLSHN